MRGFAERQQKRELGPLPLFEKPLERDRAKAVEVTNRAVAVATIKVDPNWLTLVRQCIISCSRDVLTGLSREFTSDDVWQRVDELLPMLPNIVPPKDRQAAGQVFRELSSEGIIIDTMRVVRSERPKAHRKKLTVWRGKGDL